MRIISWNTNCGWKFKDAANAQKKVDHLANVEGHFDLAFLMEYPKTGRLLYGAAVVKDDEFKEGRFEKCVSKDTRTAGLYIPADSDVKIVEHKILAPPETYSFVFGYVVDWHGVVFHVACLWNYIPKDCHENDYMLNIGRMLESSST